MELTSHLVSIVGRRNIRIINTTVHADGLPEVVDLVQAQLAVQMKEYYAVLYCQVRVCSQVPNVQQILVVQHVQCIPEADHTVQIDGIAKNVTVRTTISL